MAMVMVIIATMVAIRESNPLVQFKSIYSRINKIIQCN
jgi:hypothetical protein